MSLSEKIDTTSAAGKMVFRLLAVLNEFERDQISERTAAALRHKKQQRQAYSPTPYGFDRVGDMLVVNEQGAERPGADQGTASRRLEPGANRRGAQQGQYPGEEGWAVVPLLGQVGPADLRGAGDREGGGSPPDRLFSIFLAD